jgi:hypothetical protein
MTNTITLSSHCKFCDYYISWYLNERACARRRCRMPVPNKSNDGTRFKVELTEGNI